MNQLERVKDILSRITYKQGWKLSADWEPSYYDKGPAYTLTDWRRIIVFVRYKDKDVLDPTKEITVSSYRGFSQIDLERMKDEDIVQYFIHRAIWEAEEHEYHEWFKLDGVCVFDPHPELKKKMA
jgi:hypothetical protein